MDKLEFDEKVSALSKLLIRNGFSISERSDYFINYFFKPIIIKIGYDSRIRLFDTWIGLSDKSLNELTPEAVKEVFNDETFKLQSTLTIDNLFQFFTSSGRMILSGKIEKIKELSAYSNKHSSDYNQQYKLRNITKELDNAWNKKEYHNYINFFKKADSDLLAPSYVKKYEIAFAKAKASKI